MDHQLWAYSRDMSMEYFPLLKVKLIYILLLKDGYYKFILKFACYSFVIKNFPMDDSTLFERVTRSDTEAFRMIMSRYAAALYSFAFKIVGETLVAEDIAEDVFINLWTKRRQLKPGPSLRNFLYLSVRNLALNHIRMQKKHIAHAEHYCLEQTMGLWVVEEERYRLLSEAIDQLPPRTAEVIRYSRDGMSQEQIAHKMEITVATVKLLKSHGIRKLKEILGPLSFLVFLVK